MRLLRQIFASLRLGRRMRPAAYSAEVLFAGWVDLPAAFRERLKRQPAIPRRPTFT